MSKKNFNLGKWTQFYFDTKCCAYEIHNRLQGVSMEVNSNQQKDFPEWNIIPFDC